nr:uncharacterized protein LOC111509192 isoform X2 [Leptinotarsa decemlineata]
MKIVSSAKAVPVEGEDSFGLSQFFQKLKPSDNGLSSSYQNVDDYEAYRRKKAEQGYISICWTESFIITENKKTNIRNTSKAYSIILDSFLNSEDKINTNQNTSCYKIEGEDDIRKERIFNFTTVKETEVYFIKEHKRLFCGAGPVLSEHFIVWPKLNRKQIEVSISPMTSTNFRDCDSDTRNEKNKLSKSPTTILPDQYLGSAENFDSVLGNTNPLFSTEFPNFKKIVNGTASDNQSLDVFDSLDNLKDSLNLSAAEKSENEVESDDMEYTLEFDKTEGSTSYSPLSTQSPTTNTDENTDSSSFHSWSSAGSQGSQMGDLRTGTTKPTPLLNISSDQDVHIQMMKSQISSNRSVNTSKVGKSPSRSSKNPQTNSNENIRKNPFSTTKGSINPPGVQNKNLMISLLKRNIDCSYGNSSICDEMKGRMNFLKEMRNSSSPILSNLFFPRKTFLQIFRDGNNHTYILNMKVIIDVKNSDFVGKIKGASLKVEEESKYEILERNVKNSN